MNVHVAFSRAGGAGRSLTAALLALELQGQGGSVRLVQLSVAPATARFEPGDGFPVPLIREELQATEQAAGHDRSSHPAFGLTLRALVPATKDGAPDPNARPRSLVEQWERALRRWIDGADHIVIDLPALSSWAVWPLLHFVTTVTIPVRTSPLEIEAAVHSFGDVAGPMNLIGRQVRPRFMQVTSLDRLGAHAERIIAMLAAYDPPAELVNEDLPLHYKVLPFLDDEALQRIVDDESWWDGAGD